VPFYSPERVFRQLPRSEVSLPEVLDNDWDDIPEFARQVAKSTAPPPHSWFVETGKWTDAVQSYLAAARWTDEQCGRLLDALDESGLAGDTIVVLYSDHGFHLGEKQHWAKVTLWERSTHVPFVIVAPGMAKAERSDRPAELLSIYPTLIDLCRLPARDDLDGASLVPLLRNPRADWDRPAITTLGRNNHAVRSERYRYIRYSDGSEELYDHRRDQREWRNLTADPEFGEVIREHARWLPENNADPARKR
jgi:arylsulfatase A-like enzyme